MSAKSAKVILPVVIVLGMILRGSYLAEIARHPDFTRPGLDPAYYDYWARALAGGDWTITPLLTDPEIRRHPYFKPPGYPFFLALVYLLSGGSYLAPRIAQMLLGSAVAAGV